MKLRGVGASCIYPLLGCQARSSWRFFGTEIDDKNYQYANRNIVTNGLLSRVTLLKRQSVDPLLDFDQIPASQIDFVMCNPPFFSSREDMLATYTNKAKPPPTVCTGADVEMITEGGDEGFMLRIVDESLIWRTRCLWYTCMAGKLQTVHAVVGRLKELELSNYAITCFQGGSITRRWGIAWSFSTFRPRNVGTLLCCKMSYPRSLLDRTLQEATRRRKSSCHFQQRSVFPSQYCRTKVPSKTSSMSCSGRSMLRGIGRRKAIAGFVLRVAMFGRGLHAERSVMVQDPAASKVRTTMSIHSSLVCPSLQALDRVCTSGG